MRELETLHWHAELASGLRHSQASCLAELGLPWHLDATARRRYLAWPRYDSALDLDVLMTDWADALSKDEEACLCLRCDPELDPPLAQAEEAVREAYARHQRNETPLEVLFVELCRGLAFPDLGVDAHLVAAVNLGKVLVGVTARP